MKRFVKIIAVALVIGTLLMVPVHAEEIEDRSSAYFMSSSTSLTKVTATKIEAYFSVGAFDIMDELGASSIKIQRSSDGNSWTTMKTYSKEAYSQLICEDTSSHAAVVSYTGTAGYYYRAKITLYAKEGTGIGEMERYTSKVKL